MATGFIVNIVLFKSSTSIECNKVSSTPFPVSVPDKYSVKRMFLS